MKSHTYDFPWQDAAKYTLLPLIPLLAFALLMHAGVGANLFPRPLPALDVDRTILLHQTQSSATPHKASLLLLGDSSCLMNVAAPELKLTNYSGVQNLGTLSYLDLEAYSALLQNYLSANSNSLRTIVLLMHPEALRLGTRNPYFSELMERYLRKEDWCDPRSFKLFCWLGVDIFRNRITSRLIPSPLPGDYGQLYGFAPDLWNYLDANSGSAIDPHQFDLNKASGNPDYRLHPSLQQAASAFRSTVPDGVTLVVGITPSPEGFALRNHAQKHREMLHNFAQWLEAEVTLTNLPATMAPEHFASTTHLNAEGRLIYSKLLAAELNLVASP